jgi:hypothetical protein
MKIFFLSKHDKLVLLFSGSIAILAFFFFRFLSPNAYFCLFPFIWMFFVIYSFVGLRMLENALEGNPSVFFKRFILFSGLKIILMLLSIFIYVFLINVHTFSFLISLLVLYLAFLAFDIVLLLQKSEAHTKKKN